MWPSLRKRLSVLKFYIAHSNNILHLFIGTLKEIITKGFLEKIVGDCTEGKFSPI